MNQNYSLHFYLKTQKAYLTDMKDSGNYLPYEEIGIEPDLRLNQASEWIEQVTAIIINGK